MRFKRVCIVRFFEGFDLYRDGLWIHYGSLSELRSFFRKYTAEIRIESRFDNYGL